MGLHAVISVINTDYDTEYEQIQYAFEIEHFYGFWALQEWVAENIKGSDEEENAFCVRDILSLNDLAQAYEDITDNLGYKHAIDSITVPVVFFEDNELRELLEYYLLPLQKTYLALSNKLTQNEKSIYYVGTANASV